MRPGVESLQSVLSGSFRLRQKFIEVQILRLTEQGRQHSFFEAKGKAVKDRGFSHFSIEESAVLREMQRKLKRS